MITTTYSTGKETKSQKLKCLIQLHKADKRMHKETETRVSESYFVTHAVSDLTVSYVGEKNLENQQFEVCFTPC